MAKYKGQGPDLLPAEPELAAKAWLIARIHDLYISPVQVRLQCPRSGSRRPRILRHAELHFPYATACAEAACASRLALSLQQCGILEGPDTQAACA